MKTGDPVVWLRTIHTRTGKDVVRQDVRIITVHEMWATVENLHGAPERYAVPTSQLVAIGTRNKKC